MGFYLSTLDLNGYLDTKTNLINITKYKKTDIPDIERSFSFDPKTINSVPDLCKLMEIKSLIVHEVTHFLDFTSTHWGIEYNLRKLKLIDKYVRDKKDYLRELDVFNLNMSEIDLHEHLDGKPTDILLTTCKMHHILDYSEQHGSIVIILFYKDNSEVYRLPLSMMSLLEANAFANEQLSIISDIERIKDIDLKTKFIQNQEKQLTNYLDCSEVSKYTVIIQLCRIHFDFLNLKELLKLVSSIARFSLNLDMMSISIISNYINDSFINTVIGNSIANDMRRGASRHVIAFKTILFMYEWLSNLDQEKNLEYKELLKNDPYNAIKFLWDQLGVSIYSSLDELELTVGLKEIILSENLKDNEIISTSVKHNRSLLQSNYLGLMDLSDFKLVDLILEDKSVVKMPNRIDIDVVNYNEENIMLLNDLTSILGAKESNKFHLPLGSFF